MNTGPAEFASGKDEESYPAQLRRETAAIQTRMLADLTPKVVA